MHPNTFYLLSEQTQLALLLLLQRTTMASTVHEPSGSWGDSAADHFSYTRHFSVIARKSWRQQGHRIKALQEFLGCFGFLAAAKSAERRVKCRVSQGCGVTRRQPERRLHSVTSELSKAADGHRGLAHCWGCLPQQAAFKLHWLPIEKLEKLCVVKPLWRRKTPYRGCQGVVGTLIFRATSWLVTYRAGTSVEKQETLHLYQLTWQSVTESYWPTLNLTERIFPSFTLNGPLSPPL